MQRYADGTPRPPAGYQHPPPYMHHHHHQFAPPPLPPPGHYHHLANPYTAAHAQQHQHYAAAHRQSVFAHTIYEDEDTQNVQYTTELNAHLRKAKPRKRVSLMPPKDASRKSIAIHEDATSTLPRVAEMTSDTTITGTLGLAPLSARHVRQSITAQPPRRRRISAILADRLASTGEEVEEGEKQSNSMLKKEARRRTIYIPDDTTVMTIHPGAALRPTREEVKERRARRALSPDMGMDLVTLSEGPESPYPVLKKSQAQVAKKAPRKSLAVPPKRAPLGASRRHTQVVSFAEDITGAPTGKENLAPLDRPKKIKPLDEMARTRLSIVGLKPATPEKKFNPRMRASLAHVISPGKRKGTDSILDYSPKPTKIKTSRAAARADAVVEETLAKSHSVRFAAASTMQGDMSTGPVKAEVREKRQILKTSSIMAKTSVSQYQVLSEDLAHPSLYEDHWLDHQEISLTQLLNDVFEPRGAFKETPDPKMLRKGFLDLYHDPQIPLLHKRLQASLLYGALSIPKDLIAKAGRVKDDVGLKRRFLDLFVESYEAKALRAALEVIVGREVAQPRLSGGAKTNLASSHSRGGSASHTESARDRSSTGSTTSDDGERRAKTERRALERFIDIFLIKHEDAVRPKGTIANIAKSTDHKVDEFGSPAWAWRRTVLRSLLLIMLLDKAKSANLVEGCLFKASAVHKASTAVLTGLSALLLPSLGDIIRPLSHLNYAVSEVQYPLQEYTYPINNLASDLRDGVRLTRLVELMLLDKHSVSTAEYFSDNTMTLSLPTGDSLTSSWTTDPAAEWILSQHLKLPCLGRAQKVYNVQIALSALRTLNTAAAGASLEITPEDIVDGHRERTLSLLWAIVGYHGLARMVDWRELKREIRHYRFLMKKQVAEDNIANGLMMEPRDHEEAAERTPSLERCTKLLLAWAQSIAALQGIRVTNLTTSFADSRVLEAIVDAYAVYLPGANTSAASTLTAKLTALGCSAAFISLYSNAATAVSIPTPTHTLSTLTFLCTRLLPASRTHRAALTLQRAWRVHRLRSTIPQRVALARLAHHCAVVVRTRERVVGAAVVLQRAWRGVLERRFERVVRGVVGVQALGRGWILREKMRIHRGGKVEKRRVVGGW